MPEQSHCACGRPVYRLCDFWLGIGERCDAPMCKAHTHQHGIVYLCGTRAGRDSIDYCPHHHAMHLAGHEWDYEGLRQRKRQQLAARKVG